MSAELEERVKPDHTVGPPLIRPLKHSKHRLESRADACQPPRMKPHGDTVTLEKFLRPLARGLSPELARAYSRATP